jgi:hypothetical protein
MAHQPRWLNTAYQPFSLVGNSVRLREGCGLTLAQGLKDRDALLACPRRSRWPKALSESKPFWSARRLFRYVCVGCGNRLDKRQTHIAVRSTIPEGKKPPG